MNSTGYRQVTAVWLAAVAVLVLALLAFHWVVEREEMRNVAESQASVVAGNAAAALVFGDERAGTEILASLAHAPDVVEAALYRGDGTLLARFDGGASRLVLPEQAPPLGSEFGGGELRVAIPALLDGRRVGTAALRVSLKHLRLEMLRFVAGFGLIAVLVVVLGYLATRGLRRRLGQYQDDLAVSHAKLRQMVAHREDLLDAEHKRIAMEIHDELGQILTAALMNLRSVKRSLGRTDEETARLIEDIQRQLDAAYRGMKNIATELHPAVLQFGFVPALEWLAERILKPAGLHWRVDAPDPLPPLEPRQAIALFRIVQESLTNVVRHAGAASVHIVLTPTDGALAVEVADDGRGLAPGAQETLPKFGLIGMRERAESVGAHVTIGQVKGTGTCVRVVLPLIGFRRPLVGKEKDGN